MPSLAASSSLKFQFWAHPNPPKPRTSGYTISGLASAVVRETAMDWAAATGPVAASAAPAEAGWAGGEA
jgi:hypothetical protein